LIAMVWDLTKKHAEKHDLASCDPAAIQKWKEDLLPKIKEATKNTDIKQKLEALSEACFLFSSQMAYDSAMKTRALVTVMKHRHGLTDEEIEKCLTGSASTLRISTRKK